MLKIIDPNITLSMDTYGVELKYYAGRLCSCVADNAGLPKISCGCNLGFWYGEPETIYGIRTSVDYKFTNTPQGRIYDGGAKFTIPKFYLDTEQKAHKTLSQGDVIVVEKKVRRDTDILKKGVRDSLFAFDIQEIISVAQQGKVYTAGTDYEMQGTNVVWLDGGACPEDGTSYSVEFLCKQQYKVWDAGAKDRGTDEAELPRAVLCVLRRYVEQDQSNPIDTITFDNKVF